MTDDNQTAPALEIPRPEPWPEPVNGAQVLNELVAAYEKYVILPDYAAPALALWTLQTYKYDCFEFAPRLAIVSPEKRCGKSTLLTMLNILACKTLMTSNISAASIFRVIEMTQPTLLIDEADTFLRNNPDMGGILNAGHRLGGTTIRTEYRGKYAVPTRFKCYSPCAIAAINKRTLSGTLLDRSIIITMRRKLATERTAALRIRMTETEFQDLKRKCARFMDDNAEQIAKMRPVAPIGLSDRAADNWEAMFAIADFVSPDWRKRARNAALALYRENEQDDDDTSMQIQLLLDLRDIFGTKEYMSSQNICNELGNKEERIWSRFGKRHEQITPYHLGRLLRGFGIKSRDKRNGCNVNKAYFAADFAEVFERYLPPPVRDNATTPETQASGVAQSPTTYATTQNNSSSTTYGSEYDYDFDDIPY